MNCFLSPKWPIHRLGLASCLCCTPPLHTENPFSICFCPVLSFLLRVVSSWMPPDLLVCNLTLPLLALRRWLCRVLAAGWAWDTAETGSSLPLGLRRLWKMQTKSIKAVSQLLQARTLISPFLKGAKRREEPWKPGRVILQTGGILSNQYTTPGGV